MQEQAPKNEEAPKMSAPEQTGTVDPTATAIAKRLAEIQDKILDVTKDISNEELAKLRSIKAAGTEKLKQLAAEGKVPGAVKEATVSLVRSNSGIEVKEVFGATPKSGMEKAGLTAQGPGIIDIDDPWANENKRLDRRQQRYEDSQGGK